MRSGSGLSGAALLVAAVLGGPGSSAAADGPVDVAALRRLADRAGLRVLEGRRLVLATDRPARDGDGVACLPAVFDQAFEAWCRHYRMDPGDHPDWRCFGCLVVDRERFRAAGLLPDSVPPFVNGFCDDHRFWLVDQSNPAYRRHLVLHEGVHAFTLTLRGLATPVWYNEGIAEYLATHRLEPAAGGGAGFVLTPLPDCPQDVEQLGRIEKLRELRDEGSVPGLADVLASTVAEHGSIADYATSWAAVALLANHPAYAPAFATLERGPLGPDLNRRLAALPGWDAAQAARDFDAFTADVDYGWDFTRMEIDWSSGSRLEEPRTIDVDAARGWQNGGVALTAGSRYAFAATGRVGLGPVTDPATGATTDLESEPDGISLAWYRGRPEGRLLVGQWIDGPARGRPRFAVVAEGARGGFTARSDGPVFFRVNLPPRRLAECRGNVAVRLEPAPGGP